MNTKFKVWETVQKVMLADGFALSANGAISFYWNKLPIHSANAILLQFTGKEDWYEGDILKLPSGNIRVIVWDNGAFHLRVPNWEAGKDMPTVPLCLFVLSPDATAEVIGNQYSHPYLLTNQK